MAQVTFQRETYDWAPLTITRAGEPYTGTWEYQIVPYGSRPTGSWSSAVLNNGVRGVNIQGLPVGTYRVFYRITGVNPYQPVPDPVELVIV